MESWRGVLSGEQQRDRRQEEAEGELTQASALTAVCRRRSVRSGRTARGRGGPQVLGWALATPTGIAALRHQQEIWQSDKSDIGVFIPLTAFLWGQCGLSGSPCYES